MLERFEVWIFQNVNNCLGPGSAALNLSRGYFSVRAILRELDKGEERSTDRFDAGYITASAGGNGSDMSTC